MPEAAGRMASSSRPKKNRAQSASNQHNLGGEKRRKVIMTHPRRTFARTSDLVYPWIRAKFLAHGPSVSSSSSSPDSPGGPSTAARQLRVGRSHRGIFRIFAGLSVVHTLARHSVRIKCKFRGPVGIDIRSSRNCNCGTR